MNYGFIDDNPPELEPEDESDRLFIQLYHMNIRDVDLAGKQVLEVGSGRGGGAVGLQNIRTYTVDRFGLLGRSSEALQSDVWVARESHLRRGQCDEIAF